MISVARASLNSATAEVDPFLSEPLKWCAVAPPPGAGDGSPRLNSATKPLALPHKTGHYSSHPLQPLRFVCDMAPFPSTEAWPAIPPDPVVCLLDGLPEASPPLE